MKLKSFYQISKSKILAIIFTIICLILLMYVFFFKSHAYFEVKNTLNIIEGTVQPLGNVYFAFYVDEKPVLTIPSQASNYSFDPEKSYCSNGASISWINETWSPNILNLTTARTKCNLYFYQNILKNYAFNNYSLTLHGATIANNGRENSLVFDGIDDYAQISLLPASINWKDGFTIEFQALWKSFNYWSRIIDFGNGAGQENIVVANKYLTSTIAGTLFSSNIEYHYSHENGITLNQKDSFKIIYTKNTNESKVQLFKNNVFLSETLFSNDMILNNVDRVYNYIGKSLWTQDGFFHGEIYSLKISLKDNTPILDFRFI